MKAIIIILLTTLIYQPVYSQVRTAITLISINNEHDRDKEVLDTVDGIIHFGPILNKLRFPIPDTLVKKDLANKMIINAGTAVQTVWTLKTPNLLPTRTDLDSFLNNPKSYWYDRTGRLCWYHYKSSCIDCRKNVFQYQLYYNRHNQLVKAIDSKKEVHTGGKVKMEGIIWTVKYDSKGRIKS